MSSTSLSISTSRTRPTKGPRNCSCNKLLGSKAKTVNKWALLFWYWYWYRDSPKGLKRRCTKSQICNLFYIQEFLHSWPATNARLLTSWSKLTTRDKIRSLGNRQLVPSWPVFTPFQSFIYLFRLSVNSGKLQFLKCNTARSSKLPILRSNQIKLESCCFDVLTFLSILILIYV